MAQAAAIRDAVDPDEVLFVLDAMIGQDAVTTAEAFREGVGFTGVVLTKLDGDARGGAALSVREVTGVPILFASTGEKLEDFDVFHPDRMASRILGMGDVLSLIEQAEQVFDAEQAEAAAAKIGSRRAHAGGLPRADAGHPQDGPDRQPAGHAARRRSDEGRARRRRRQPARPRAGHHPRHDARRARRPEDHQRVAPAAHRQRLRGDGVRGQPARRPVLRGPQDDVADGRPDGNAVRPQGFSRKAAKGKKKGKKGEEGRGPTPPKVRNPLGAGGMPAGFPDLSNMPKGLDELPPGLADIDLSKLKFPGQK